MQRVQEVSSEHKLLVPCFKVIGRANSYSPAPLQLKGKKGHAITAHLLWKSILQTSPHTDGMLQEADTHLQALREEWG